MTTNPYILIAYIVLLLAAIPVIMWLIVRLMSEFMKSNTRLNDAVEKSEYERYLEYEEYKNSPQWDHDHVHPVSHRKQ